MNKTQVTNRQASNVISGINEINRATFRVDGSRGFQSQAVVLGTIFDALLSNKDIPNFKIFQCSCGSLFFLPDEEIEKTRLESSDGEWHAVCPTCGPYEIAISEGVKDPIQRAGLKRLNELFDQAVKDNATTLSYYLIQLLGLQPNQINQIIGSADLALDLTYKHTIESNLRELGLSPMDIADRYIEQANTVLQLLIYNHLYELTDMYDVLLSLLLISDGTDQLYDEEMRALTGAGHKIVKDDDPTQTPDPREKIGEIKKYCNQRKLGEISDYFESCFDSRIRDAVAHSQYLVDEKGITLTRYKMTLSHEEFDRKVFGVISLTKFILDFVKKQRKAFIESDGVKDGNITVSPITDGNKVAVRIEGTL